MAQGLITYNGALLLVNGGLTVDPNCCCDPPPDPCPPCCIRIDFGTFDSDGNLVKVVPVNEPEDSEITITITLPRPYDRIICDGDQITVKWQMSGPGDTNMTGGRLRHGAAWHHRHNYPVETTNGRIYDYGLTDFGFDSVSNSYEVILEFVSCFLDVTSAFLGYLIIETESPTNFTEEIDVSLCPTQDWCCLVDPECEDCCAILATKDVLWGDGYWVVYDVVHPTEGHFTTLVLIQLPTPGKVCKGDAMILHIFYIPPRHSNDLTHIVAVEWNATWLAQVTVPPLAGGIPEDAIRIEWPPLNQFEYSISFENNCQWNEISCTPSLVFANILIISDEFPMANVGFEECNVVAEICCPLTVIRCCPDPLPRRVRATIYDFGNCECGEGVVIEMLFNDDEDAWIGTGDFCGTPTTLRLDVTCEELGPRFELSVDGACTIVRATSAHNCPPDFQTSNFFVGGEFDDCCGSVGTSVQVIIRPVPTVPPCD